MIKRRKYNRERHGSQSSASHLLKIGFNAGDGSLIDSSGMELLQAMAEEQDAQIIIERVSNGEKIGIVIEDGSVVSAEEGAAK